MGDGMPYMMTKGPVWQYFDDWFSDPNPPTRLEHKIDALIAVHTTSDFLASSPGHPAATPVTDQDWPKVKDKNAPANEIPMPDGHFSHWFDTGGQSFGDCSAFNGKAALKTGWWAGWAGDAEAIVREAFIRTIEVSLELDHVAWSVGATKAEITTAYGGLPHNVGQYDRNWALDFSWVCPQPMFRASVKWRKLGNAKMDGLVSLTFLTPGLSNPFAALAWSLDTVPAPAPAPPKLARPAAGTQTSPTGSWIVGHKLTLTNATPSASMGTVSGQVPKGGPELYSCGDVIAIAPELHDGGVS